jgi:hypothetical protein
MRIEADDEIYRVNAVWLGPEQFQFPWRATYRAYGLGIVTFVLLLTIARQLYGVTFWSVVFTFVVAIKLTQVINKRLGYERPFSSVVAMAIKEINAPRRSERRPGLTAAAKAVLAAQAEPSLDPHESGPARRKCRQLLSGRRSQRHTS